VSHAPNGPSQNHQGLVTAIISCFAVVRHLQRRCGLYGGFGVRRYAILQSAFDRELKNRIFGKGGFASRDLNSSPRAGDNFVTSSTMC
jgi:hypothetical protein